MRSPDKIPYQYGNRASPLKDTGTRTMVIANRPKLEDGNLVLIDKYDPQSPVVLQLLPVTPGKYIGVLSGKVETGAGWKKLNPHAMKCAINFRGN